MLPAVRQALGLPAYHCMDSCQPHAWQLYRHISIYKGDNACLAGAPFTDCLHFWIILLLMIPLHSHPGCLPLECSHASACKSGEAVAGHTCLTWA